MKKIIQLSVVCVVILLCSCSSLTGLGILEAANPLKDESGINTNVQLGKENTSTENKALVNARSDVKNETSNSIYADKVDQLISYKDAPWLILAFAIAFAAPNPFTYFKNKRENKLQEEEHNELKNEIRGLYRQLAQQDGRNNEN